MGSEQPTEKPSGERKLGKVDASLKAKLQSVEWGAFRIGDLFEIKPTKAYKLNNADLFNNNGINPVVTNSSQENGVTGYTKLEPTEKGNIITYSDTTTSDAIFYQPYDFVGYSHIQGLYPKYDKDKWQKSQLLYFVTLFKKSAEGKFSYGHKFNRKIASQMTVQLPISEEGEIDFGFMEDFIAELEAQRIAELEAYLSVSGLKDYTLTPEEEQALHLLKNNKVQWGEYAFNAIFNKIKQGRRLKKEDHIKGNIPFIMAGTTNTGVVNYISNPVASFPKNSITVDIFGNTFYRNYAFGAGDDTGVYWNTEIDYSEKVMLYITTAIDKSLKGKFSYGKKLRSSQSHNFKMQLPTQSNAPDFAFMALLISAIQKQVIKEVVLYTDRKIQATKQVVVTQK